MKNIFFLFMDIIFSILFRFPFCIGKEYWWLAAWDSWAGLSIQSFVAWPERNKAKGISGRRRGRVGEIWVVRRVVDGSAAAARRRSCARPWRWHTFPRHNHICLAYASLAALPLAPADRYLTVDT